MPQTEYTGLHYDTCARGGMHADWRQSMHGWLAARSYRADGNVLQSKKRSHRVEHGNNVV
ncbi:hypothetical protein HpSP79_02450 [Helicobacter pylori]